MWLHASITTVSQIPQQTHLNAIQNNISLIVPNQREKNVATVSTS